MTNTPEFNPERGRQDRADTVRGERRRRSGSNLDRMVSMKMDIFSPDQLDLNNYVYRWVNDEDNRVNILWNEDYDHCGESDVKNYNPNTTNNETDSKIRKLCGKKADGSPLYAYLMKKPREYWEADNNELVARREAMMNGVVYNGDVEQANGFSGSVDGDNLYATKNNQIGGAARRKGLVK